MSMRKTPGARGSKGEGSKATAELPKLPRERQDKNLSAVSSIGLRFEDAASVPAMHRAGLFVEDPAACRLCDGAGNVLHTDAKGNRSVSECECRRAKVLASQLARSGLPIHYSAATLENYHPRHPSQMLAQAKARGWCREFLLRPQKGITFTGPVGTGKTHLAVGMLREMMLQYKVRGRFTDTRTMLKSIQDSYSRRDESERDVMQPFLEVELLVLDELGAGTDTEWRRDTLEHIIGKRYDGNLRTIVTTNMRAAKATVGQAERNEPGRGEAFYTAREAQRRPTLGDSIGDRMMSRLLEMNETLVVDGDDYRETGAR